MEQRRHFSHEPHEPRNYLGVVDCVSSQTSGLEKEREQTPGWASMDQCTRSEVLCSNCPKLGQIQASAKDPNCPNSWGHHLHWKEVPGADNPLHICSPHLLPSRELMFFAQQTHLERRKGVFPFLYFSFAQCGPLRWELMWSRFVYQTSLVAPMRTGMTGTVVTSMATPASRWRMTPLRRT